MYLCHTLVRPKYREIKQGARPPFLKGVFAENERGYRLHAIKKRF